MLEEFDVDARIAMLDKYYEKISNLFQKLRTITYRGIIFYSTQLHLTGRNYSYDILYNQVGCNDFGYVNNHTTGISYNSQQEDKKAYQSEFNQDLVSKFQFIQSLYEQMLRLIEDKNDTIMGKYEMTLKLFRADMMRLRTDISYVLRMNEIATLEEEGKIDLDNTIEDLK